MIKIYGKKNKIKKINYFKKLLSNSWDTQSNKSIFQLELNMEQLGVNEEAIKQLKEARNFYHQYSHPGILALSTMMSFTKKGEMLLGGCYDEGKVESYKKEKRISRKDCIL